MALPRPLRSVFAFLGLASGIATFHAGCSTPPTFVPDGPDAGSGGSGGAPGAGCKITSDCPGMDTECAHRTCTDGKCGMAFQPDGFATDAQQAGDCQKAVCDGKGEVKSIVDNSDKPSDGNDCTADVCESGVPKNPPAKVGVACGSTAAALTCDGAGHCAGCKQDSDCGTTTACASYTCDPTTTICTIKYVANGQGDPGGQVPGDCQKSTCNGSGSTASIADDTDVPDDDNPCTTDLCAMGQPSHGNAPASTACGASFTCDGAGNCKGCSGAGDCGQSTACATFSCVNKSCQPTYVPSGMGDPGQTAGDCMQVVCDGNGGTMTVLAPDDIVDDGNPCTADTCSASGPVHTAQVGMGCGGSNVCDKNGTCVGCVVAADCAASNTACVTYSCLDGSCQASYVPSGQGSASLPQMPGDCQLNVCNGSGGTTTIADTSDPPATTDPCAPVICVGASPISKQKKCLGCTLCDSSDGTCSIPLCDPGMLCSNNQCTCPKFGCP